MANSTALPGGYSFIREIGRGTFARIYEGRATDGRLVAIKMPLDASPVTCMRFMREAKVLRALPSNRHIVGYIDSGTTADGTPFLVLELLDGTTLATVLDARRRFTEPAAAALLTQLCDAFIGLHKLGVTHGDVKPTNMMLTTGTGSGRETIIVKLLDFGLVRGTQDLLRLSEDWQWPQGYDFQEDLGSMVAADTADYVAPEMIDDAQGNESEGSKTDTPSDVFSLGVILYILLTGHSPWPFTLQGDESFSTPFRQYLRYRHDEALIRPERISAPMWSIVSQALSQNPRGRHRDARLLRYDLQRFIRNCADADDSAEPQKMVRKSVDALYSSTAITVQEPPAAVHEGLSTQRPVNSHLAAIKTITGPQPQRAFPSSEPEAIAAGPQAPSKQSSAWTRLSIPLLGLGYTLVVLYILWMVL